MTAVTRLGIYSAKLPSRAEDYAAVIAARGSFQAAKSVQGRAGWAATGTRVGDLPAEHAAQFRADKPDYVIYSYQTPIAWHSNGTWRMPNVRYSVTTTQHQWIIWFALRALPEVTEGRAALDAPSWRDGTAPYNATQSVMKGRGHSPYGPRKGGW